MGTPPAARPNVRVEPAAPGARAVSREARTRWDILKDALLKKALKEIDKVDVTQLLAMGGPANEAKEPSPHSPAGPPVIDAVFEDHPGKVPRRRRKAPPSLPAPEQVPQPEK